MKKDEIKKEIEKARKHLEALEKKLAQKHSLGDESVKSRISDAADYFRAELEAAGLKDISISFGQVTNGGDYADRSLFLSGAYHNILNGWKWKLIDDTKRGQQVLVRVDIVTGECID